MINSHGDHQELDWKYKCGSQQHIGGSESQGHRWAHSGGRVAIKKEEWWRLNNTLLNNQQITEEIKKEIKIFIETNENENTTPMDRSAKQKINKETQTLNDTIDQLALMS